MAFWRSFRAPWTPSVPPSPSSRRWRTPIGTSLPMPPLYSASDAAAWPQVGASAKSAPPRLSIVVLPFANMGGNPEQEYFVDGVTESLTTDLSRMNGMLVIARNTAFTYKGKHVDLKQIGHEL